MAWHGMACNVGATAVSPGRLVACCLMSVARSMLRVFVCVRVCYAVGLGRRSGVGWLPSGPVHSVATGRRRCRLHERVALVWLPCRRAAMRRSSPSWCSSEPTWRCRTPSGVLLDRDACTMQQTPCKRTPCKQTACKLTACKLTACKPTPCKPTPCKPTPCGVMGALDRAMCKVHRCGRQLATCEQSACIEADGKAGDAVLVCCSWTALMHAALGGHTHVRHSHAPCCSCASKRHMRTGNNANTRTHPPTRALAHASSTALHAQTHMHTHTRTHAHTSARAHADAARVGYAASEARHRCRVPSALDRLECTAHAVGCTLSFICCVVLSVAQLHGVSCMVHVLRCMPHIVCRLSSAVSCIIAWCQSHGACFALPVGR
jgi:hypothetical protein